MPAPEARSSEADPAIRAASAPCSSDVRMARPYGRGRRLFNLIAPWPIVLWVLAALVWPGAVSAPRSAVSAEQPKLLLLGDSLFAGYGLPPDRKSIRLNSSH